MIAKKQAAKKRRLAKKNQKLHAQESSQKSKHHDSMTQVSQYDELSADTSESKKKRGRPRKDESQATDDIGGSSKSSKKKGKNKRIDNVDYGGPSEQPKSVSIMTMHI